MKDLEVVKRTINEYLVSCEPSFQLCVDLLAFTLRNIMTTCVLLHKLITEDERFQEVDYEYDYLGDYLMSQRTTNRLR
jgi:hypothetical protein